MNEIQIFNLCREIEKSDFEAHEALEKKVKALAKLAGKGLCVGKLIRFQVADGYALYFVTKVLKSAVHVCHVPLFDRYTFPGAYRIGNNLCIPRAVAARAAGWDDAMEAAQNRSHDFFQHLQPGQIVHYSNGFNQFVRCQVTADKQLLPIALVGDWREFDLPRRQADGSIYLGYHAQSIHDKRTMLPHASNVWECPDFDKARYKDPTNLPAIDLTVPPMDTEEELKAAKVKLVERIHDLTNERKSPDEILQKIRELL